MTSIESIWDDPVEDAPRPQKQPLFLDEPDDVPKPPEEVSDAMPEMDVDIDAMFADIGDDDEFTFTPLGRSIDPDALRKEAEARHRANLPLLTPHAITSSSPPRGLNQAQAGAGSSTSGGGVAGGEKSKTDDVAKARRRPVVLDEGRLLGPDGFPKLLKEVRNFRPKGKGHEAGDLDRLLRIYGYWTHGMYPKTTFRDTVERVEKLCHSKRMNVALSVWRDEFHGRAHDKDEEGDADHEGADPPNEDDPSRSNDYASSSRDASSPSRPPSLPPSSGSEPGDDDFDIDAIIREEEERLAKERRLNSMNMNDDTDANAHGEQRRGRPVVIDEDEDGFMQEHASDSNRGNVPKPNAQPTDDDEDMWDVVREMESAEVSNLNPAPTNTSEPVLDDDFESMWL